MLNIIATASISSATEHSLITIYKFRRAIQRFDRANKLIHLRRFFGRPLPATRFSVAKLPFDHATV
jgi:hypothetical protein